MKMNSCPDEAPSSVLLKKNSKPPVIRMRLCFEKVNHDINSAGFNVQSRWPAKASRCVKEIENQASALFCNGDSREVLLFAALKVHPEGPYGDMVKLALKAFDILNKSANKAEASSEHSNLAQFLKHGSDIGLQEGGIGESRIRRS